MLNLTHRRAQFRALFYQSRDIKRLQARIRELESVEDRLAEEQQLREEMASTLASLERELTDLRISENGAERENFIKLVEGDLSNVSLATLRSKFGNQDAIRIARALYNLIFINALKSGLSLSEAAANVVRTQASWGDAPFPMPLILSLLARPSTRQAGYLGLGLLLARRNLLPSACDAFLRADLNEVRRFAWPEFIRALVAQGRDEVRSECELLSNLVVEREEPGYLHSLFRVLYGSGFKDCALSHLDRIGHSPENKRLMVGTLKSQIAWLPLYRKLCEEKVGWHNAAAESGAPVIAVYDYKQPDVSFTSSNIGDYIQTLAMLGCVARLTNIEVQGHEKLTSAIAQLRARIRPERIATGQNGKIALTVVDRDAISDAPPPPGTWLLAVGWHMHKSFSDRLAFPFDRNVRPIFISFHCNKPEMLSDERVQYLKRFAPIGCRDWTTVYLLNSRGVAAFFSGCLTTTVDTLFPPNNKKGQVRQTAFIDSVPQADERDSPLRQIAHAQPTYRQTDFATNLERAVSLLDEYRTQYDRIVTSRLHAYLPCAAMGLKVAFRPNRPSDIRFDGLTNLGPGELERIRNPLLGKTATILGLIATGADPDAVYAAWSDMCREDVERSKRTLSSFPDIRIPTETIRRWAAPAIKSPASYGEFSADVHRDSIVHIGLAADKSYAPYLCVALHSILRNTERPIQFHVLVRGFEQTQLDLIGKRFATRKSCIQFLALDHLDYGKIAGMYARTTFSTMDRLLLPRLLPEVKKLAYIDIDVVVLGDVGELYDLDLGGQPIAARSSIAPEASGGFSYVLPASSRLAPDTAIEFRRRMASRADFGFPTFNAGVLVLDLEHLRKIDFCEEFLPYVSRYGLNDQELLNCFAAGNWCPFGQEWNAWPTQEILDAPKLVHFVGINKPWMGNSLPFSGAWQAFRAEVSDLVEALP